MYMRMMTKITSRRSKSATKNLHQIILSYFYIVLFIIILPTSSKLIALPCMHERYCTNSTDMPQGLFQAPSYLRNSLPISCIKTLLVYPVWFMLATQFIFSKIQQSIILKFIFSLAHHLVIGNCGFQHKLNAQSYHG